MRKAKAQISCAVAARLIADQRLCFRFIESTIPLLKSSNHILWLYSLVCVRPGWKPRKHAFSLHRSIHKMGQVFLRHSNEFPYSYRKLNKYMYIVFLKSSLKTKHICFSKQKIIFWANSGKSQQKLINFIKFRQISAKIIHFLSNSGKSQQNLIIFFIKFRQISAKINHFFLSISDKSQQKLIIFCQIQTNLSKNLSFSYQIQTAKINHFLPNSDKSQQKLIIFLSNSDKSQQKLIIFCQIQTNLSKN